MGLTFKSIVTAVIETAGLTVEQVSESSHLPQHADARSAIVWIARRYGSRRMSYPDLGARLGGRDHTTMMHAERRVLKPGKRGNGAAALVKQACERLGVPCDL
jgi:chromosomal replication initiator protein